LGKELTYGEFKAFKLTDECDKMFFGEDETEEQ
jgi:hypothetical protein